MIERINFREFCFRYAFNEHRKKLLRLLVEDLDVIKGQCDRLRVLIFGSYISFKKNPKDIDILLALIPNRDSVYAIMKSGLRRKHPGTVDVQFNKAQRFMKDADSLIRNFNENPLNKRKGIVINDAVELTDF